MAHDASVVELGHDNYVAGCLCGWTSDPRQVYRTFQQAEDQVMAHDRMVERARHHLSKRDPSLSSQRDYYQSQADNPQVSPEDRALWAQLAQGLSRRLDTHRFEQGELFLVETVKG